MKNKNYVSVKLIQVCLLGMILVGYISASDASCSDSDNDLRKHSEAILAKIEAQTGDKFASSGSGFQHVSYNNPRAVNILDHTFHKIDLSAPELKPLEFNGIITGNKFENKNIRHATASMISPCHVLTNRHAVEAALREKGDLSSLINGKKIYFSVGRQATCDSKDQFSNMNLEPELINFGENETTTENGGKIKNENDWAILKLKQPVQGIQAPYLSGKPLQENQTCLRIGFPDVAVKASGGSFKNPFAQYVKGISPNSNGIVTVSDTSDLPGLSGGSITCLSLSNDKKTITPKLVGINVGEDATLSVLSILDKAEEKMAGTKADILKAIRTGKCE